MSLTQPSCRLCGHEQLITIHHDQIREYRQCQHCQLILVPDDFFLAPAAEKSRYDLHENNSGDSHYRNYLKRLFDPLIQFIKPSSCGLDFGSGPGPTLSVMLAEAGYDIKIFDRFYANNTSVFNFKYDFITATEVLEHLHNPAFELERLWNCLKQGGIFAVMTKLATDQNSFKNWHYIKDLTHVCFYSQATFMWLVQKWRAQVLFMSDDVVILKKAFTVPEK